MNTDQLSITSDSVTGSEPKFVPYTAFPELEAKLEHYLLDASPYRIPDARQSQFTRVVPWVTLLSVPLSLFNVSLGLGLATLVSMTGNLGGLGIAFTAIVSSLLRVCSIPGLFAKTRAGWSLFLYGALLQAVTSLLQLSLTGTAIGVLIAWLAFQVKHLYK